MYALASGHFAHLFITSYYLDSVFKVRERCQGFLEEEGIELRADRAIGECSLVDDYSMTITPRIAFSFSPIHATFGTFNLEARKRARKCAPQ